MSPLQFFLFGPPTVKRDGKTVAIDARKSAALLAYLATTGTSHSRETLLALLWPELQPQRAQNVLRRNLSTLNKSLDGQWLVIEGDVIGLDDGADVAIDIDRFRELAESGQDHDHPQSKPCDECLHKMEEAAAIYSADFLAGFSVHNSANFDNWQMLERDRLQREYASVLEGLVQGYSARQAYDQAIAYAQHWLALDPLRETVQRHLMLLYAQNGDRTAAVRQYQIGRQLLQDELGVEPETETIALYERLLLDNPFAEEGAGEPVLGAGGQTFTGPPPPSPYRGLFAFQEEHAAYFFGRDVTVIRLVERLHKWPMASVIGPSGSGKSSVIFAGLVPALRKEGNWMIVTFRPGSDPFLGLASALLPHLEPELSEIDTLVETQKSARALANGELSLTALVDRIVQKNESAEKLLLVTDQFEELYTLCPAPQVRQVFLLTLLETIEQQMFQREPALSLLFTLRADFMEQALAFRPLADAFQAAALMLGPMLHDELCDAIQQPAEMQGVTFEAGLVDRILNDVGNAPGNLPLLEFALAMLWDVQQNRLLTHEGYEEIGRVEGALTLHAEAVYNALDPDLQHIARRLFIQLVWPGAGTEDTCRVARRDELGEQDWALVQQLANARLVITGRDAVGNETVEVVHEALITNWGRFREWMEADRTFRSWQERLRASMRQWETSDYNEGALLRGVPLAEGEGWLAERAAELSGQEIAYIQASSNLQQQRADKRESELLAREKLRQRILQGILAGLVVGVLLLIVAGWQFLRAEEQRRMARTAQDRITQERNQAQRALSRQLAAQATALQDDQLDLSILLSVEASGIADTVDARRSLRSGLAANARLEGFLHGHTDRVTSVAYSADGRMIASGSNDNTVLLWDVAGGMPQGSPLVGHSDNVLSVDLSPDDQVVASGGADRKIILWDVTSGQPLGEPLTGHEAGVSSVVFSPDGSVLASSGDETILLWSLTSGTPVSRTLSVSEAAVRSIAFSPDGQLLASGSDDKTVILWNVNSGEPVSAPLTGHTALLRSVAFSPDGQLLASAGEDGEILLWDLSGEPAYAKTLADHGSSIRSIQFNPNSSDTMDGAVLASAGTDGTIILWDVATGEQLGEPMTGHNDWVRGIAFSPDGQTLVSASHDKSLILWNIRDQIEDPFKLGALMRAHLQGIRTVAFSPDGQIIASGGDDETIVLWNASSGQPLGEPLRGHVAGVRSVAFSPDGRILASGADDERIILWDVAARQALGDPLRGHTGSVRSVAFSPNGQTLASGSKDETVMLWNAIGGEPLGPPIRAHDNGVQKVAFSPDGRYLASAGDDSMVKLWEVSSEPLLHSILSGHGDVVFGIAFSPDGRTLASSSWDKNIMLWDVESAEAIGLPMSGHKESVQDVVFSPDGQTLASGSWDESVILWDATSGLPLTTQPPLIGHSGSVRSVDFSDDGRTLASASDDGTIILWNTDAESWQMLGCERANRNFTREEWQRFFGDQPYAITCPNLKESSK